MRTSRRFPFSAAVLLLSLALACLSGCLGGRPPGITGDTNGSATSVVATAPTDGASAGNESSTSGPRGDGTAVPSPSSIPRGETYANSTEGHVSYSFREEWRRAIVKAQEWDRGAFLVQAFARDINNQGVPSQWSMFFKRQTDGAYEIITMDPWGSGTAAKAAASGAKPTWSAISPTVIDSNKVVSLGAQRFSDLRPAATSRKQAQLIWTPNHSGMQWVYVVFDSDSGAFLGEVMDANTGDRIGRKKFPVYEAP